MTFDARAEAHRRCAEGQATVVATVVWRRGPSSGKVGAQALIHPDGSIQGWIGGACAQPAVIRESMGVLAERAPRVLFLGPPEELPPDARGRVCVPITCHSDGALEVYLEPVLPAPQLVIVGVSGAVTTLATMAAALGWEITASPTLDGGAVRPGAFLIVATQGADDEGALETALATEAGYVGLVASHKRAAVVMAYLRERGVETADLQRVHAPAGLDLGPTTHDEIAVAILADLVARRAAGELRPALPVAVEPAPTGIDPVCGMSVALDGPLHTVHEGVRVVFCGRGCLAAFTAAPTEYTVAK